MTDNNFSSENGYRLRHVVGASALNNDEINDFDKDEVEEFKASNREVIQDLTVSFRDLKTVDGEMNFRNVGLTDFCQLVRKFGLLGCEGLIKRFFGQQTQVFEEYIVMKIRKYENVYQTEDASFNLIINTRAGVYAVTSWCMRCLYIRITDIEVFGLDVATEHCCRMTFWCDKCVFLCKWQSKSLVSGLLGNDGEAFLNGVIVSKLKRNKDVTVFKKLRGHLHEKPVRDLIKSGNFEDIKIEDSTVTNKQLKSFMVMEGMEGEKARLKKIQFRMKKTAEKRRKYKETEKERHLEMKKNRETVWPELNEAYYDFSMKKIAVQHQSSEMVVLLWNNIMSNLPVDKLNIYFAVSFMYKLFRARNSLDVANAIGDVIAVSRKFRDVISVFLETQFEVISNMMSDSLAAVYQAEDLSELKVNPSDFLLRTLDGPVAGACASIVSLLALSGTMPEQAQEMAAFCVTSIRKPKNIRQMISYLSDIFERLFNIGNMWNSGIGIKDLVLGSDSFGELRKQYTRLFFLSEHPNMLYKGAPQENKVSYISYAYGLNSLYSRLRMYDAANKAKSDRAHGFDDMLLGTARMLADVRILLNGYKRTFPYGLVIHGKPGVGKSSILDHSLKVCAACLDMEWSPELVYTRGRGIKFWDGYDPLSNIFIKYTEGGNVKFTPNFDTSELDELNRLMDSQYFPCDMAFEKGKTSASPQVVVVDTNNKFCHADNAMFSPDAIKRRNVYVEVIPKQEFKTSMEAIDAEKSRQYALDHPDISMLDRYIFKVETYVGKQENHVFRDLQSFTDFLIVNFNKHLEKPAKANDAIADSMIKNSLQAFRQGDLQEKLYKEQLNHMADEKEVVQARMEVDQEFNRYIRDNDKFVYQAAPSVAFEKIYLEIMADEYQYCSEILVRLMQLRGQVEQLDKDKHPDDLLFRIDMSIIDINKDSVYKITRDSTAYYNRLKRKLKTYLYGEAIYLGDFDLHDGEFEIKNGLLSRVKSTLFVKMAHIISGAFFFLLNALFYSFFEGGKQMMVGSAFCVGAFIALCFCFPPLLLAILSLFFASLFLMLSDQLKNWRDIFRPLHMIKRYCLKWIAIKLPERFWRPVLLGSGLLLIVATFKILKKFFGSPDVVEEQAGEDQEVYYFKNTLDEVSGARRPTVQRTIKKDDAHWTVQHTNIRHVNYAEGFDNFMDMINKNIVKISNDGRSQCGFLVSGGFLIMNEHFLEGGKTISMSRNDQDDFFTFDVTKDNMRKVGHDLLLVRISIPSHNYSKDRMCHIAENIYTGKFTGGFRGTKTAIEFEKNMRMLVNGKKNVTEDVYRYDIPTKEGYCGLPLVMINGKSCAIIGFHSLGSEDGKSGLSVPITRKVIQDAMEDMSEEIMPLSDIDIRYNYESMHKRSLLHWNHLPYLDWYGKLPGNVMARNKSRMIINPDYQQFMSILDTVLPPISEKYGRPMMEYTVRDGVHYNPYAKGLLKMNHKHFQGPTKVVVKCVKILTDHLVSSLRSVGREQLYPVTLDVALNGIAEDPYLNRINISTSAGYGYSGKKEEYMPLVDDFHRILTPDLIDDVKVMMEIARDGKMSHPIYSVSLKDEPRVLKKCQDGSTRLFYVDNLSHLIMSKILLSDFYSMLVDNREMIHTAVGIDSHRMGHYVKKKVNPTGNITCFIEGDWSGFDVNNPIFVSHAAASVIYNVHKAMGYNHDQLEMLRGLLTDGIFPCIEVLRDFFMAFGLTASGQDRTAEYNGLKNLMLMLIMWYSEPKMAKKDFFKHVYLLTYGDDLIGGVSSQAVKLGFGNLFIRDRAKELFNMDYTSASKDGTLRDYLSFEELSFLKRNIVIIDDKRAVCPISSDSIRKSLLFIRSSAEPHDKVVGDCVRSQMYEIFNWCYGDRNIYNSIREQFIEILNARYAPNTYNNTLPTFYECEDRMWGPNYLEITDDDLSALPVNGTPKYVYNSFLRIEAQSGTDDSVGASDLKQEWSADNYETKEYANSETREEDVSSETRERLMEMLNSMRDPRCRHPTRCKREEIRRLERILAFPRFKYQSSVADATDHVQLDKIIENVTLLDRTEDVEPTLSCIDLGEDCVMTVAGKLERPIQIYTTPYTDDLYTVGIWDLVTRDPVFRSTVRNYAYARFDIEVTINITAGPGDRGLSLCSYQPFDFQNANLAMFDDYLGSDFPRIQYLSQAAIMGYIRLNSNNPLVLRIPYVSPKAMGKLFNQTTGYVPEINSLVDFDELGTLFIIGVGTFSSTTGFLSQPQLEIYACIKNLKLAGPTGTRLEVLTQSEFKTGPVERIASNMLSMAEHLAPIPIIGSYARASMFPMQMLKNVSAHYGWSRPVVKEIVRTVRPRQSAPEQYFLGSSTANRMVGDPENELTVDPRIGGGDTDDMAFATICKRKSFLENFEVSPLATTFEPIYMIPVHPQYTASEDDVTNYYYVPTTIGFVAQPHNYWTGSISYRFMFQTSAYDRMKVGFWWEPNVYDVDLPYNLKMNKQAMVVLDLATAQEVDITVHWGNDRMWLETVTPAEMPSLIAQTLLPRCNGRLIVCPITKLHTPDAESIWCSVLTWSDDLRVNFLDTNRLPRRRVFLQSGENATVSINRCHMNTSSASLLHFGEEPVSFRSELKRYEHRTDFAGTASASQTSATVIRRIIPVAKPAYGNVVTGGTLLEYLMYAYLGVRGSVRRQLFTKSNSSMFMGRAVVRMSSPETTRTDDTAITFGTGHAGYSRLPYALTSLNINPCLEIETPYVSPNLFQFAFNNDSYGSSPNMDERQVWRIVYLTDIIPSSTITFNESISAGEDFNLLQFCGSPLFSIAK